jgi:hypothetical protein
VGLDGGPNEAGARPGVARRAGVACAGPGRRTRGLDGVRGGPTGCAGARRHEREPGGMSGSHAACQGVRAGRDSVRAGVACAGGQGVCYGVDQRRSAREGIDGVWAGQRVRREVQIGGGGLELGVDGGGEVAGRESRLGLIDPSPARPAETASTPYGRQRCLMLGRPPVMAEPRRIIGLL